MKTKKKKTSEVVSMHVASLALHMDTTSLNHMVVAQESPEGNCFGRNF